MSRCHTVCSLSSGAGGSGFNSNHTSEYITLEQTIRNNGHRHLERAIAYASAQWPEHYYQGSMKKAERNFKRANSVTIKSNPYFEKFEHQLANAVANQIMYDRHGHVGYGLFKETKCQKCLNVLLKPFKMLWRNLSI